MRMINLKMMVLNAENLFLLSDVEFKPEHLKLDPVQWRKLSTSIYENKPLHKLRWLAKVIESENPDLVLLSEVGGLESLQNFNRLFLQAKYSPVLIEGNSDRNIDVGYLVRKNLDFYYDLISNKNRLINDLGEKFSRDVAELHLFVNDREKPFFVFLLTHLKSRLDPEGKDPNGFFKRKSELQSLVEIYSDLQARIGNTLRAAICGDFNGNAAKAQPDVEFAPLYEKTDLRDVLDLSGVEPAQRWTYAQVGRSLSFEGKQLDYAFLSSKAAEHLDLKSTGVHRYKDEQGIEMDPPRSMEDKDRLPSVHYPLIFQLINLPMK